MATLKEIDKLVVNVLVDNTTDSYSSKPDHVVSEFVNVTDAGAKELSGETLCCAQLGLSLMLTTTDGSKKHKLLLDAGPEGAIFLRNCKNLGVALGDTEEIAITHGHWDHMGALTAALGEIAKTKTGTRCHVNPGMFLERGAKLTDGRIMPFEKVPSPEQLTACGAEVINDPAERTLLNDNFFLSGEITRVTGFERGRVDHMCRESADAEWKSDPLLMDERYLAVRVKNKGLIIFSACSHAGIVNVLRHAQRRLAPTPIYCIFGGLHLVGSLEKIIGQTVESIKEYEPKQIVPAHCTGWRAVIALVQAFGEQVVVPSQVGSQYTF